MDSLFHFLGLHDADPHDVSNPFDTVSSEHSSERTDVDLTAESSEDQRPGDKSISQRRLVETPNYYDWQSVFPDLAEIKIRYRDILEEAKNVPQWTPWPEDHYANDIHGGEDHVGEDDDEAQPKNHWTVFPFLHTFPATDESKKSWIRSTCAHCPITASLLGNIPNIKTALFSRLAPGTKLSSHTGWADLANYVFRCHLALEVPADGDCGLVVHGETKLHSTGEIIVFDDSKPHKAFNNSPTGDRIVLIVDILRPSHFPLGTAKGGHTAELDGFISQFK